MNELTTMYAKLKEITEEVEKPTEEGGKEILFLKP